MIKIFLVSTNPITLSVMFYYAHSLLLLQHFNLFLIAYNWHMHSLRARFVPLVAMVNHVICGPLMTPFYVLVIYSGFIKLSVV